jgi:hypothetical protein
MFLWPPAVPAPTVTQVKVDGSKVICDIEETFTSIITVSFVFPYARTVVDIAENKKATEITKTTIKNNIFSNIRLTFCFFWYIAVI